MNDQQIAEFMRKMYGYGAKQTLRTIETVLQKARASIPRPPKPVYIGTIETHVADSTFKEEEGSALDQRNKKAAAIPAKHRQEHIDLMEGKLNGQDVSMFAAGQHKTASGERPYIDPNHRAHVTADAGPRGYLMYHPDTAATQHAGTKPSELWRHGVRTTSPSGQSPVFSGKSAGRDDSEQAGLESKTRKQIYEILNRGVDNGWSHDHAGLLPIDYDPTHSDAAKDKAATTIASKAHFDKHIATVGSATPPEIVAPPVSSEEPAEARATGTGITLGGSSEMAPAKPTVLADLTRLRPKRDAESQRAYQAFKDFRENHVSVFKDKDGKSIPFPLTDKEVLAWIKLKRTQHEELQSTKKVKTEFDAPLWDKRIRQHTPTAKKVHAAKKLRDANNAERAAQPKITKLSVAGRALTHAGMPDENGKRAIPRYDISLFNALPQDQKDKFTALAQADFDITQGKKDARIEQNQRGQATRDRLAALTPAQRRLEKEARRLKKLEPERAARAAEEAPAKAAKKAADDKAAAEIAERKEARTAAKAKRLAAEKAARPAQRKAERVRREKAAAQQLAETTARAKRAEASRVKREDAERVDAEARAPLSPAAREAAAREYGGGSALASSITRTPKGERVYPGPHHLLQRHKNAYQKHGKSLGEHEKIPELANMDGPSAHTAMQDINADLNSNELGSNNTVSPKMASISAQYEALHDRHRIQSLPNHERNLPEVKAYEKELLDWHTKVLTLKGKKDASGFPRPIPPPPFMENDRSTRLHPALRKFLRNPFS